MPSKMSDNSSRIRGQQQRQQLMLQLQWQLLLLLLLLLLGWCSVSGNSDVIRNAHQLRFGTHKLCGHALNLAMDQVCENGFNTIQKRRSEQLKTEQDKDLEKDKSSQFQLSPILSGIYGTDVLIKTRRLGRQLSVGIHNECCVHSCTYSELLAYCRPLEEVISTHT